MAICMYHFPLSIIFFQIIPTVHRIDTIISMDSIGEECKELKKKYDECFNEWFGEYLKGKTTDTCHVLFKEYRNCVHKVLETKGIDVNEAYAKVLGTSAEKTVPEKESAAMKKSDSKSK